MNLADKLEAIEPAIRGPRCSVGLLLAELDEPDRKALLASMADPRKQTTDIHRVLRGTGISVAESAIARHRILPNRPRRCACPI